MLNKTHLVIGGIAGYLASFISISIDPVISVPLSSIGAIMPDMDHKKTFAGKLTGMHNIFGHRTYTHSLICIPLGLTLFSIYNFNVLAFNIGYISHILADYLTPMGVPFLYPISKKRRSLRFVRTGSLEETAVRWILIVGIIKYIMK